MKGYVKSALFSAASAAVFGFGNQRGDRKNIRIRTQFPISLYLLDSENGMMYNEYNLIFLTQFCEPLHIHAGFAACS